MEIFDGFGMNGIENYPAAGKHFLDTFLQTHFSKNFYPKAGYKFFKGAMPP